MIAVAVGRAGYLFTMKCESGGRAPTADGAAKAKRGGARRAESCSSLGERVVEWR